MNKIIKYFSKNGYRIGLAVGYIFLLSPFVYSVFYSMPANDDFAWAIEWWSGNRLVETFHRMAWNYNNSFGQSGFAAIFIQVMFNPLYWFKNAGHSFGICMVIVFLLIVVGLIIGLNKLIAAVINIQDNKVIEILTFLVLAICYTCYYYSDVYNWWSGTPGYAGVMVIEIFAMGQIIKHQRTLDKKSYIWMIVLGVISCSGMMYCAVTGVFYVLYVFIFYAKNGESLIKKVAPLILYIASGLSTLVAPGNHTRMGNEDAATASLRDSVIVTVFRVILRIKATFISKPWMVALLIILLAIGIFYKSELKIKLWQLILAVLGVLISIFGALLPYVYGANKALDSEITGRVWYIVDYITFIGIALLVLMLGIYIGNLIKVQESSLATVAVVSVAVILLAFYSEMHGYTTQILQYDIAQKASLIKESYYFWDDILNEVESADEGSDVVITCTNVTWCPYVYYVSLDEIYRDPVAEGFPYGNCNQCASIFYGVRSIVVNLE